MKAVTGGTFTMGATKEQETKAVDLNYERPIHQVTLTYANGWL